ncbi:MAG: hypothetical protein EXS12_05050 [Phycisphaerales bacterium]|nr:hypothetical protein [Phycisphaerales bacterium]
MHPSPTRGIIGGCGALACGALACGAIMLTGCNTMNGPAVIEIDSANYSKAFEACIEAGRSAGMPPQAADRTTGIIETEPRTIGSWVEPWRFDSTGALQKAENTTQFQRRRVRFVFTPKDWQPESIESIATMNGPAAPGSKDDLKRFDLETYKGPIEIRARVFVERNFTDGMRINTWSSTLTSQTQTPTPGVTDGTTRAQITWTPVGRDEASERTIMAEIQTMMDEPPTSSPTADVPSS